jgi:hypothetical protein
MSLSTELRQFHRDIRIKEEHIDIGLSTVNVISYPKPSVADPETKEGGSRVDPPGFGIILATNAVWSLLSHLLSRGSLMVAAIILARALPTPAFAAYSYFQMTVSMLAAYAALGLGVTASRYFAEVGHEQPDAPPAPWARFSRCHYWSLPWLFF